MTLDRAASGGRAPRDLGTIPERYDRAFEESAIGMAIEDLGGRFVAVNAALCHLVGYTEAELLTMSYMDICHPDDLEDPDHLANLAGGGVRTYIRELRYLRADRAEIWVRVHIGVVCDDDGIARSYTVQIEDVNHRHRAETRFRQAFDDAAVGMALVELTDRGDVIVEANAKIGDLLGRRAPELIGSSISAFVHPDDLDAVETLVDDLRSGLRRQSEATVRFQPRPGPVAWAHLSASAPARSGDQPPLVVLHAQDITTQKVVEGRLVHQAGHDALTGLPNRHTLTQQLDAMDDGAPAATSDSASGWDDVDRRALLFVDLDRFKLVNDSLGHTVGDELLVAVARRLRNSVAEGDLVARIGGDEFVVLARSTPTAQTAETMAARLLTALHAPFRVGGRILYLTASIGIALPGPDMPAAGLLRAADLAMHGAKAAGKARAVVFEPSMRQRADSRLATEQGLHRALEDGELILWYQSVVSLVTHRTVAAEALIRWQHPGAMLLEPADFLPVAEETGLILPIGRSVLRQALDQVRIWRDLRLGLTVNVNLAASQLETTDLVEEIRGMLDERGLLPRDLCLEVSETAIVHPDSRTARTVTDLRDLGVSVAVDDFGRGNSSLSYLRSHPVDVVKIDRSFVATLDTNPRDAAIVGGIVQLTHALGMTCIAQGVEHAGQLAPLRELGCDQAQGWLTGRAAPGKDWLDSVLAQDDFPAAPAPVRGPAGR
jgi:diguanylate cyclase (GGDEF)-like protein/PAS domain S-box-containing protein